MSYEVLRTTTADEQIRDIASYIASASGDVSVALRFVDRLEKAARRLAEFPRIGAIPRWGTLAKRGYRSLTVGEYVIVYVVDDEQEQVTIHAVVYGRREYWNLI